MISQGLLASELSVASVKFHIGVTHRLWYGLPHHHLQVSRLEAVVVKAMNDSGGAGDAVPGAEIFLQAAAIFFLEEHRHISFQDEKHLFDRMRVRRIAFARRHEHHRQPRRARWNMSHLRLTESFADIAELRSTITVVVRITEHAPVRLDVGEANRVAV